MKIHADRGLSRYLTLLLNCMATIQLAWFYVCAVPSALDLDAYENGQERLPFQHRLLMMFPLRWAHHSAFMGRAAVSLTHAAGWFPGSSSIRAEGTVEAVVEAVIDIASIAITGLMARRIYEAASRSALLTPFVYPLTLLMIAVTYTLQVNHALRFVYDLPAMAFFSAGLYLIYFRRHALFAGLFVIATINRETTLLLLPVYWISQGISWRSAGGTHPGPRLVSTRNAGADTYQWRSLGKPATLAVVVPLAAYWLLWHIWVDAHFAANRTAAGPRLLLNLATLLCPIAWPQLLSAAAWLWPFTIASRNLVTDATLRLWVVLPALFLACMLFYGLLIETRVFGELIPYFAITTALIAEEKLFKKLSD